MKELIQLKNLKNFLMLKNFIRNIHSDNKDVKENILYAYNDINVILNLDIGISAWRGSLHQYTYSYNTKNLLLEGKTNRIDITNLFVEFEKNFTEKSKILAQWGLLNFKIISLDSDDIIHLPMMKITEKFLRWDLPAIEQIVETYLKKIENWSEMLQA